MLRSHIKLGRIFGITIGLHFSWIFIVVLIVLSFARVFRAEFEQLPDSSVAALAAVATVVFFTSLLLHELSHSIVARSKGIAVREITLFALGGVSQFEAEPRKARDEFLIASAGPLASVVIASALLAAARLPGIPQDGPLASLLTLLGYVNLALAAFNMVPGYPLDGGRILRAVLWWRGGDLEAATRKATTAGQAVAGGFILFGILSLFAGRGLGGLWIAFIGWFLLQASAASYLEMSFRKALARVRVADVMTRECPVVNSNSSVQELVDEQLLRTGRRCFVVVDQGSTIAGLVTPKEITGFDRRQWPFLTLDRVMKPLAALQTVCPGETLASAMAVMTRENINEMPVVEDGQLLGLLDRSDILRFLENIVELRAT